MLLFDHAAQAGSAILSLVLAYFRDRAGFVVGSLSLVFTACIVPNKPSPVPSVAPAPSIAARPALPKTAPKPEVILGYSAAWADGSYPPRAYDYGSLTHIARSFLAPHADGRLTWSNDFWNPELEQNAHAHGVKLLASIGGAADDANQWLGMARDPAAEKHFFDELEAQLSEHHYDGVDIDWEPTAQTDADQATYTEFMRALRRRFPHFIISTALPSGEWSGKHISWPEIASSVDFINLMTYVFAGSWTGHSAHNANLFAPSAYTDANGIDIDSSIASLTAKHGLPRNKVVLGLAFYGTQYSTDKLGQVFPPKSRFRGEELLYSEVARLAATPDYSVRWDAGAHAPYLERFAGGHTISFDDARSTNEKCVYASESGLKGVMIWYLGADLVAGAPVLQRALSASYGLPISAPSFEFLRANLEARAADLARVRTETERELRDLEHADPALWARFQELAAPPLALPENSDAAALSAKIAEAERALARLEIQRADVQRALASVPNSKGRELVWPPSGALRVSDFEANDLRHALGGTWSASFDKNDLGTVFHPEPTAWSSGGHGSARALHTFGHFGKSRAPWPFAALVADFEPTDFTSVRAVRFWAKGNAKDYALAVHRAAIHDYAFPLATFRANADWSLVEIPLSELKQPNWGQKLDVSWTDVNALALQPGPAFDDEDFDLWVDDLELVKG
ncbi:MAG TPA: glycosyl hydrolase family 18 protein [Polyangiaceae bacterium]|nr:glycosyl hydrolase family 18 protein [Polyangiaceae bacterium]